MVRGFRITKLQSFLGGTGITMANFTKFLGGKQDFTNLQSLGGKQEFRGVLGLRIYKVFRGE